MYFNFQLDDSCSFLISDSSWDYFIYTVKFFFSARCTGIWTTFRTMYGNNEEKYRWIWGTVSSGIWFQSQCTWPEMNNKGGGPSVISLLSSIKGNIPTLWIFLIRCYDGFWWCWHFHKDSELMWDYYCWYFTCTCIWTPHFFFHKQ